MIIEQDESLTEWIKKRIVEICDAEPVAFAKYVLALLKKDSSEEKLREICEEQLNVFLGSNTKEFVDGLFDALNTRSYLPSSQEPQSRETAHEAHDSQDSISPKQESNKSDSTSRTQRRRISPPRDPQSESRSKDANRRRNRSRSRSPARRRVYNGRDRHRSRSRSRSRSPHRRDHHRRERSDRNVVSSSASRIRCRDYEEKGLCSKGEKCLYDHGPNAIVLDGEFNANPPPGVDVKRTTASNVEAYNPEAPGISAPATSNIAAFMPNFSVPPPGFPPQMAMNPMPGMMPMNPYMQQQQNLVPMQQGGFVRGRGRGRGGRYGFSERVQPNKSSTIEVRRIPPEVNKLGIIHKHFEQFGDITNIQISFDGQKDTALVTYSKLPDAQAAMKSQKPILDNRFIQVAWHKPPPPKPEPTPTGEIKTEQDPSLANVKPVIPLMTEPKASTEHIPTSQLPQAEAARRVQQLAEEKLQARRKERQMQTHLKKIHMLKTQLYEKQVAELKGLFDRISKATDPKVKAQLATMVKKLDEALKGLTKEIHDLYEQIQKSDKSTDDSNGKLMKKRRLNSTASADENTDELEPVKKKQVDEPDDAESQNGPPTDQDSIRKLLAQSDDSDEDEEPNKSRVKVEEEDEDEKVDPLLESTA